MHAITAVLLSQLWKYLVPGLPSEKGPLPQPLSPEVIKAVLSN